MSPQPFNWRDYVTISEEFSAKDRALLEQTMDAIAAAHDGDGEKLIQEAARTFDGKKVPIVPGAGTGVIGSKIELNMQDIAFMYTREEPHRAFGLGPVLVHELYHAAEGAGLDDPKILDLVATVAGNGINARALRNEAHGLINNMPTLIFMDILTLDEPLRKDFANDLVKSHPQFSKLLQSSTAEQWTQSLIDIGVVDSDRKTPADEKRATLYTDAFVQKNWGDQYPMRKEYTNWLIIHPGASLDAPKPLATPQATPGFVSPLSSLSIEPVVATPAIEHIKLPDVSSLRGCSTDGQHYCDGTTGTLAGVVAPGEKAKEGMVLQ